MATTTVSEEAGNLNIAIEHVGERKATILNALQECAEGRCSCPTTQYERLQSIEIAPKDDGIAITLTPKPGEAIDRQAIDKCLEYTVGEMGNDK